LAKKSVLVIEDDADIRELARYNLAREGYDVIEAPSGEEAVKLAQKQNPDIILLDLMLPGIDGLEVCRLIRADAKASGIPIVMLTAKSEESDIISGLEVGADDYITKPFSPRVLIARVRAVLRRTSQAATTKDEVLKIHNLLIHPARHEVLMDGDPIELTATEFRVLQYLAQRPGWVRTRYQIVDSVHGADYPVTERSVDVQIAGLRKKLGPSGKLVETVHGVGYRFKE
jgi:two-component system phosphate regulon response regulator PhoB